MEINSDFWRQCSSCKKPIAYSGKPNPKTLIVYYECSVSTCTRKRTGYIFCSVSCWERHLPGARHRNAGAVEKTAPTMDQWKKELSELK